MRNGKEPLLNGQNGLQGENVLSHIYRKSGELAAIASWAGYSTLAYVLQMAVRECERLGNASPAATGGETGAGGPMES
jgi:hypothetical protein